MSEAESEKHDCCIDFERIKELISKYEQIKKSCEIKRYNEESTKKDFISHLWSGPLNDWSKLANKNINILNEILKGVWGEQ